MPFLAPVFAGVTAFASTALGGIIINSAISIGASLLSGILFPPTQPTAPKPSGMRLEIAMGETIPLSFPVGYCATAGSRKYAMSWGNSGEVPNAYRTEVVQISDMLLPGLAEFWAFKQKCTILWGDTPTAQGYPVEEFRVDGVDYMWVKFRTGVEVTADAFMFSKFGTHPQYPWTKTFIGREAPHAIVTMLFNRELFKSDPAFLFVPTPMKFYDLRKDSTNGGSGLHRWNNQATWESTVNPVVIIYNIVRGIYRTNGTWVYGGRNLPVQRLPASSWMAAANECDAPRSLDGGGTEPQFRCGIEINVDIEPLTMIEELLRTCSGRMAEIGGIFEILVGAPGAAVYSFTDANIMISRGQKYSSFPGLNDTHNAIEATYVEPSEMWVQRAAPGRFSAAYEAQDGGRRLATGVSLFAVPYGVQAQQLMRTLVEDDRKWRTHWITLPPDAWILTGTCVVNWTSERNGYVNKKFLVISASGEPGMCQSVVLREIDPTDYSWSSDDQLPNPVGNLVIVRTPPQVVTGFSVSPAIIYDADGTARRPAIDGIYDGNMPDIRAVHVLVRLTATGVYEFEGEIPFNVPYTFRLAGGWLLPDTSYEVAIKYVPFTGRPTDFTAFQEVTTPDIRLVSGKDFDPYDGGPTLEDLNADLQGNLLFIGKSLREAVENAQALALRAAEQDLGQQVVFQQLRREASANFETLTANYTETITVFAGVVDDQFTAYSGRLEELSVSMGTTIASAVNLLDVKIENNNDLITAQANAINALNVSTGTYSASGQFRTYVAATEAGALATIGISAAASSGGVTSIAALFLSALTGGLSRVTIYADQFVVQSPAGPENPLVYDGSALRLNVANIGTITAGLIQSGSGTSFWNLNTGDFRIST